MVEKNPTISKSMHVLGIVGLLWLALAGYAHFDYMDYGFVCVTQGKIDMMFAIGIGIMSFYAGYVLRWYDEK